MDKFIVSARKYRPQLFDTVVGQSHITTTLKNAIRHQQLAHAFLFCGPRGVGKTTCARILAKTINCENQTTEGEACNECHSCVSFNEGTSMNIHELDAASNNSVDDIRTLVEQVRFAPQAGKYKVYIIDEVHMLSSAAFNAFLKTLEEPPPYAIFILATTEKHKILPTILSRCQIFDFKRITTSDTVDHLREICKKEDIKADKASLHVIAQKSEGCMRDALSIMDKIVSFTNGALTYSNTLEHLNILDEDYYFKLLDGMQQQDLASAMLLFDDINQKGFEGDMVINGLAEFMRNLLVCKDERVASLLEVVEGFREKYIETAKQVQASWLISALNILNESEIGFKAARNKKLHVELALIKLTYLQQAIELTDSNETVTKKKLADAKTVAFRNIAPIPFPEKNTAAKKEAKLIIESAPRQKAVDEVIAENIPLTNRVATSAAISNTPASSSTKISLQNIRQQFAGRKEVEVESILPLTVEKLMIHWKEYTAILRSKRNPAVPCFDIARLRIVNDSCFEVVSHNNLEQKFIEGERNALGEFLQKAFNNSKLQYSIVIDATGEEDIPHEKTLTTRDQFIKIVEQYPLVMTLKERLKLDLDY
ncbi:MAG: DNA polymerase III subunit gamma/tau [Chitinophagaceae bacterium]|nr:DNA polymerase III subunit gamma/tau [Chitinophagaceae bacterium]